MTLKVKNTDLVTSITGAMPLAFLLIGLLTGQTPTLDAQSVITDVVLLIVSWYVGK